MTTTDTPTAPRPRLPRIRGRHRRPRPRKAVLAAGGLALAAGALSLVRLVPEPGGGALDGYGAEAAPRVETGRNGAGDAEKHRGPGSTAGTGAAPGVSPSATSVMGGLSASPRPGDPIPGPSASGSSAPRPSASGASAADPSAAGSTTVPQRPNTPDTPHAPGTGPGDPTPAEPQPPAAGTPVPRPTPTPTPTPTPSRTTPAPRPEPPGGLCVPLLGVCVDLLDGDG
ncbi:hypothetical protein ABZ387_35485 [Streptomyces flaveolus]|uniref:hypothetical protein n=1 Tax=Streptomyces flaveolus TaxID=67297 RepID=UPI0033D78B27